MFPHLFPSFRSCANTVERAALAKKADAFPSAVDVERRHHVTLKSDPGSDRPMDVRDVDRIPASPTMIEVALHYDRNHFIDCPAVDSPRVQVAVTALIFAGLLRTTGADADRRYDPTAGLDVWIKALCGVPMPIQRWVIPNAE